MMRYVLNLDSRLRGNDRRSHPIVIPVKVGMTGTHTQSSFPRRRESRDTTNRHSREGGNPVTVAQTY